MRYTPYRGLTAVKIWVRLKFAAMNLKKFAIHKDYDRKRKEYYDKCSSVFSYLTILIIKQLKPEIQFAWISGFSTVCGTAETLCLFALKEKFKMKSFIKSRDSPSAMEAKKITFYERRKKHEYSEKILICVYLCLEKSQFIFVCQTFLYYNYYWQKYKVYLQFFDLETTWSQRKMQLADSLTSWLLGLLIPLTYPFLLKRSPENAWTDGYQQRKNG